MFMNLDINLNAPRFDLLASRQLSFLTLGFTRSQHFDAAYKVTTLHFGYGLDSLLECLVFPASYLAQVYDDHDDHDGVFEYEVSETVGDLLATLLADRNGQLDWRDFIKATQPVLNRFFQPGF